METAFQLSGIIDQPQTAPLGWVLFTHCFTCTKDIKLIVRISRGLAERGYAVLRYDLTGLGHSHGDFAKTNFTTNQADVLAAAEFLTANHQPPDFWLVIASVVLSVYLSPTRSPAFEVCFACGPQRHASFSRIATAHELANHGVWPWRCDDRRHHP